VSDVTSHVFDVDEADFQAAVLERSKETPVVVDFWAAWCGPCHTLGPMVEQAVANRDGDVVLAKVEEESAPCPFDIHVQAGVSERLVDQVAGKRRRHRPSIHFKTAYSTNTSTACATIGTERLRKRTHSAPHTTPSHMAIQ
jgi:thiol-disulfide isomerase/thioredoxin